MGSLLYIHGFNSSARGIKARQLTAYMGQINRLNDLNIPNLPIMPLEAISLLESLICKIDNPTLVGSSLGGYYATYLANKYSLKTVLVNPVVFMYQEIGQAQLNNLDILEANYWSAEMIGNILRNTYNSDQTFINEYIHALNLLTVSPPTNPEQYQVWLKKGDEILDYRFAEKWYQQCDLQIDEGGDHSFVDFYKKLPKLLSWVDDKSN